VLTHRFLLGASSGVRLLPPWVLSGWAPRGLGNPLAEASALPCGDSENWENLFFIICKCQQWSPIERDEGNKASGEAEVHMCLGVHVCAQVCTSVHMCAGYTMYAVGYAVVYVQSDSVGARCQHRNRPEDGSSPVKQHPAEFAGWRLQTLVATRSYMKECLSPSHPWIDSKY